MPDVVQSDTDGATLGIAGNAKSLHCLCRPCGTATSLPKNTAWVNYLRCHDDIGWTFDDEDAAAIGINAYDHRQFLNHFYTGQFRGSFARGVPFQENQQTGDMRISGTMASLAGLEQAIEENDEDKKELAIRRMMLLHGVSLSIGGIPLLYMGEEWGMLNDYDFIKDPAKAGDSRWIHRPKMKWEYSSRSWMTTSSPETGRFADESTDPRRN